MKKFAGISLLALFVSAAQSAEPRMVREAVKAFYNAFVERPNAEALLAGALRGLKKAVPSLRVEMVPPPGRYLLKAGSAKFEIGAEAVAGAAQLAGALEAALNFVAGASGADISQLEQTLVREMTASCGERWTSFIGKRAMPGLLEDGSGASGSTGIVPVLQNARLQVLDVEAGSPAEKAGVRRGQAIDKIAGLACADMSEMEAVALLRGKVGGAVEVAIDGKPLRLEFATWNPKNLEVDPPRQGIARVRLADFRDGTARRLEAVLDKLAGMGMKGLALDLRGNPGGLLDEGRAAAGLFLDAGVVARVVDREHRRVEALQNPASGKYSRLPLALLVDGRSASVSELVALSLRELRQTKLVGQKTLGKGVVQVLIEFSDGSAVKMSTARFASPRGALLFDGLEPDLEVEGGEGGDKVWEKAFSLLEKIIAAGGER